MSELNCALATDSGLAFKLVIGSITSVSELALAVVKTINDGDDD